ncbi:MAG: endonuclease/exonuclease/phosphatase family protein [bacterium]
MLHRYLPFLAAILIVLPRLGAVTVVAYNVENFFDLDGVATYEDYRGDKYTPHHLLVKARNVAKVLAKVDQGRGPDVVILNEIELDQTPGSSPADIDAWLDSVKNRSLEEILSESPLPPEVATLPAEAWLLKAAEEAGLGRYHYAVSDERPGHHEDGRPRSVKNVILSRFPVQAVKTLPTTNARAILEAKLDVEGHPLTVFANHWKSGAGSDDNERTRIANARTLRDRLNQIFKDDPSADVIIGGDFNSHYNQTARYPEFKKSGINDELGAQGNEAALQTGKSDLYDLWFELPVEKRGSDVYQDDWGTLMHLIVSRGLYDNKGLQYQDNSFEVLAIPGLNADPLGRPLRWSKGKKPSGFSDHFPILARLQIANPKTSKDWMPLKNPSIDDSLTVPPVRQVSAKDILAKSINPTNEPKDTDFRKPEWQGKIFLIDAPASISNRNVVSVQVNGVSYEVFCPEKKVLARLREAAQSEAHLKFYGQLGTFQGRWQFLLPTADWFLSESAKNETRNGSTLGKAPKKLGF